ncbi:hypothetical protein HPNQ4216_1443 [Helicobacter pylori NQ4216]|nr:hypothetical protein HPNQ4216_1443 [Helicobacter pylori NQ4216]
MFGHHHLNLKGLNFIQFESLEYKTKILIACKLGVVKTNIPAP